MYDFSKVFTIFGRRIFMRPWISWWNPIGFAVLCIASMGWLAPKAIKYFHQDSTQASTRGTFATLTAARSSELYLKDARAFIFSRTDSGQNLKLHDCVLVGPKSEATLILSDEFGGGKIQLAANTIITLSRAGRRNEISRIDIKQGEIKILEAPRRSPVSESPGILLTSGESAVVFDEKIKSAELVTTPKSNSFEIKMPLAPAVKELSQTSSTVSPVLLEEIEEASIHNEPLSETFAKIQEAKLGEPQPQVTRREPATVAKAETAYVEAEVPAVKVKAPSKTGKNEEPITRPQEEISKPELVASTDPIVEESNLTPITNSEETFYPLEISSLLSQRSCLPANNETSQNPPNNESNDNSQCKNTLSHYNFKRGAHFGLSPFYKFSGITSTLRSNSATSTLASSYNTGVNFSYFQNWSKKFESFASFNIGTLAFENPPNGSGSIIDRKKYLSGFGIGFISHLYPNLTLQSQLGFQKEVFLRVASAQSLAVDAVATPSLGSKLSCDLFSLEPFSFGIASSGFVNFPHKSAAYLIKLGVSYSATIYLRQYEMAVEKKQNMAPLELAVGFSQRRHNTSYSKQTQTDLTFSIGYQVPVGAKEN